MGLETLPAFTAHPSRADGEQVSESGGPWGHPPTFKWGETSAPLPVPGDLQSPGCRVWLCKDSMAGGFLLPKAASCGTQMSLGRVYTKLHAARGESRYPKQHLTPWIPVFPPEFQLFTLLFRLKSLLRALCDVKQLPHLHPGCVGSTGLMFTLCLPSHTGHIGTGMSSTSPINSRPIIYHPVCKVLWKRKDPV